MEGSLDEWYQASLDNLKGLTDLVKSNLTDLKRRIIVALITTDVHSRDIIETLKDENIGSPGDFLWQKQLRYYWGETEENVVVR
jgi:dynein heavy chain